MFNIFKFFRKEVKTEIKEDEVVGVYPPLKVKLKSDQEIRLDVIEKVLNDMPDNVKDVFNMLSKKGVDTIPAYESGSSFGGNRRKVNKSGSFRVLKSLERRSFGVPKRA
jgi:hypothetical protein